MPVYEFECPECGDIKEVITNRIKEETIICNKCKVQMKKIISQTSFTLKGSGWGRDGYESKK